MTEHVVVNDVGLRDGLQNVPTLVSTAAKCRILDALIAAGLRSFEVASFVSAKAVPQMTDAEAVFARLPATTPAGEALHYEALVPNLRGLERAIAAGARTVCVVLGATDSFNRANINMSLAEAKRAATDVIARATAQGLTAHAYISMATACPYEGTTPPDTVFAQARLLVDAGARLVIVGDSLGAGNPSQIRTLFTTLVAEHGAERLAGHFHDTRGLGLAMVWAALDCGIRRFDGAIGGLGGCPFAPGATGNLATEDLVFMLNDCGFETGVDVGGLARAVAVAAEELRSPLGGHIMPWLTGRSANRRAMAQAQDAR